MTTRTMLAKRRSRYGPCFCSPCLRTRRTGWRRSVLEAVTFVLSVAAVAIATWVAFS